MNVATTPVPRRRRTAVPPKTSAATTANTTPKKTHHNNNARERPPPKSSSTEKTKATSYSTTKETPTVALGLTAATNFTNNADGAGDDDGDSSPYILDRRILLNDGGSTFRSSVAQRNDGGSNNILEMFSQESDKSISSSPGAKAEQSIASSGSCSQEEQSVQQSRRDVSKKEDEQNDCSNNDEDSDEEESISSSQHRLNQAEQANNMIFITLECGLASICRLRHLYPSNFFTKMEHEGTSVTKFNVDALRKICNGGDDKQKRLVEGGDVDEGEDGLGGGGRSIVKVNNNHNPDALSPLTGYTLNEMMSQTSKNNPSQCTNKSNTKVVESAMTNEQVMATEARLLIHWLGAEGVKAIMKRGKLARVVFGICVPKRGDKDGGSGEDDVGEQDELIESYSVS